MPLGLGGVTWATVSDPFLRGSVKRSRQRLKNTSEAARKQLQNGLQTSDGRHVARVDTPNSSIITTIHTTITSTKSTRLVCMSSISISRIIHELAIPSYPTI